MQLITVDSGQETAVEGILELSLEADLGSGQETLPFTYNPADTSGLTPQVTAWLAANPSFTPDSYVPPSLETNKTTLYAALSDYRFGKETGGITFGSTPIKTDRSTSAILTSAYIKATENSSFTVNWKVADGVFATLDASTIITISNAVEAHVQACFDREKALSDLIAAASNQSELDAIDITTGWPT